MREGEYAIFLVENERMKEEILEKDREIQRFRERHI